MRHRKDGRQFSRNTSHRRAMFRNLAANLITHERIVTTDAKAKELRRVTERLITKAKRLGKVAHAPHDDLSPAERARRLHVKRLLASYLPRFGVERDNLTRRDLIEKVMVDLTKRFADRMGGYTRITKLGTRHGDGARMSVIEFVDAPPFDELNAPPAESDVAPPEPAADGEADEGEADDGGSDAGDDE